MRYVENVVFADGHLHLIQDRHPKFDVQLSVDAFVRKSRLSDKTVGNQRCDEEDAGEEHQVLGPLRCAAGARLGETTLSSNSPNLFFEALSP